MCESCCPRCSTLGKASKLRENVGVRGQASTSRPAPAYRDWVVGVTWPSDRPFPFADELRRRVNGRVSCMGAPFPKRQPPAVKYLVVWPLFCWVSVRLLSWSLRGSVRIVCWQQAYGLALGWAWRVLEALGLSARADIDVLTFILSESKRTGTWRRLIAFALGAAAVKRIVVHGNAELDMYRRTFPAVAHKFAYLLYSAAAIPADVQAADDGYYLAVGRSNRDHRFLIGAFESLPARRLVVLTDQGEASAAPNVRIERSAFGASYYRWLGRCHAVLIAFEDPQISSGQLVYLQAVQLGKPVLVSRSRCLENYLADDRTGLYFEKHADSLVRALTRAEDPQWYERARSACLADYKARFGFARLAEGYLAAIREPA